MGKRKYENKTESGGDFAPKKTKEDEAPAAEAEEHMDATEDNTSEFNVKHFRKELNSKQGQTIALTQFLQVCTNPDTKQDYMLQYLKSGGNSHEILRQIGTESKKNLTLTTPAFHLFHLIILKVQSSIPHMIAITEEACRYFLNTFMPTVEIMISENSGPKHRKIIMKLLTSMVTLNPELGVEILNQAPLTPKHLQYIVEKANYKEKDNVRTAFVHFITSFLVEGHLPLIKALLEKQGLLSLIIPGLIHDESEAVIMFLNIMKANVIENTNISKSLKLKTFSHQVLHNMFKIYYWKGPPGIEHQSRLEMQSMISLLLSEIMLILFTSNKFGLYFVDKTLGTSDAHKNQNLYKALLSLKRPWENKSQCDVILQIVDKCPDLHRALITIIEQSFEPQNTPAWQNSAAFVIKLLDKIQPQDIIERMNHLNPVQVTNFIRFTTLPIPLLKFLKQGITNEAMLITTECAKVVVKMLLTVKKYLDILEISNSTIADLIRNRLEGFIPKHLPTPDTIVSIVHKIMKPENQTKHSTETPQMDSATSMITLLDLLLLLNDIHPTSFEGIEGHLDMKSILTYSNTLTCENVLLLKFKIISLWLSFDPSALSLKKPMFSDLFNIMIQVYTHEDEVISLESKNTLHNFLKNTSMFEGSDGEIDLVLHSLKNAKVEPASVLVEVLQHTLSNAEELKLKIKIQIEKSGFTEAADSSTVDKLFEDLFSENVQNIDYNIFIDEKIPSPFILGCLQVAKESKSKRDALNKFLSVYTVNLMHYYASPELISSLLEPYQTQSKSYINNWIEEPSVIKVDLVQNDETLHKLCRYIVNDEEISLDEIFPYFEIMSQEQSYINIRGLSLKWDFSITVNSPELCMWAYMLTFYVLQLTKLESLTNTQVDKITKCLDAVMVIAKNYKLTDVCRKIIDTIFTNPLMLNYFSPIARPQKRASKLATLFLVRMFDEYKEEVSHMQLSRKILKPYQQKIFVEVKKIINKIAKKKTVVDDEYTMKILACIGISREDTLEIINFIFDMDPKSTVTANNEPSLIIKILGLTLMNGSASESLPPEVIPKIFHLYTTILKHPEINVSMIDFESILKDYFEKQPHHANLITKESFKNFFSSKVIRKSTSQLAASLLRRNISLCEVFKVEIQKEDFMGQRELALPLGEAIIDHVQFVDDNKPLLESIYYEYKSSIMKVLEKPHKVGQIYSSNWKFIRTLIYKCMAVEDCVKFFEKVHKFETVENFHIHLIQATFMKICITPDLQKKEHLINYFTMMLSLLSNALKADSEYQILKHIVMNIDSVAQISKGIKNLDTKNKENFKKLTENALWQNFCKTALKDSLKIKTSSESGEVIGPRLLSLLSTLVKLFYPFNHEDVASLFNMVTSHSEFLNVMLSHHSTNIKSRLVEFLYILILRNKSVMKAQQIPVYLSAYHATRNPSDRLLLTVLHFYETNGQSIHEYKPYVWGDSGANYYSVRKNRTSSLWGHPTPNQILNLLDKDTIEKTMRHFPVNQRLDYKYELPPINETENDIIDSAAVLVERMKCDGVFGMNHKKDDTAAINALILRNAYGRALMKIKEVELTNSSHSDNENEQETIYDPSFVLPIMSQILAPGSVVSCFKLVRAGLLGVPLAALASHCPAMRAAGYHVLHRFCLHLETETKHRNDKLLLTDFVETLRQSLSTAIVTAQKEKDAIKDQKNPRLPAVAAAYLARSLNVATAPFHPLYKPVNNFLIAKQQIDLTVVPDFLSLFHDCDVESTDRRLWMLSVLRDGTKTMSDVNVIFKTMALKMVMDFYSTVLADRKTKDAILQFVSVLVSVPRAAEISIEGYGVMSWLSGVVRQMKKGDEALVATTIRLINNISRSLVINVFAKMLSELRKHSDKKEPKQKQKDTHVDVNSFGELKINKEIEQQILYLLVDLLACTSALSLKDRETFLNTLNVPSKKTLKLLTKKQMLSLIKSCCEGLENNRSVQVLLRAVSTSDGSILKVDNVAIDMDDSEDYHVKLNIVRKLRCIVQKYL